MEKKSKHWNPEMTFFLVLFFLGFITGVIIPNVLWKLKLGGTDFAGFYLLEKIGTDSFRSWEYLREVLYIRMPWMILCIFCGVSIFGVPVSIFSDVWMGFFAGSLITSCILQFGIWGGVLGLGLLLPQWCCYIFSLLNLCRYSCEMSLKSWKNEGYTGVVLKKYLIHCSAWGGVYISGVILEYAVSPWILDFIVKKLPIF